MLINTKTKISGPPNNLSGLPRLFTPSSISAQPPTQLQSRFPIPQLSAQPSSSQPRYVSPQLCVPSQPISQFQNSTSTPLFTSQPTLPFSSSQFSSQPGQVLQQQTFPLQRSFYQPALAAPPPKSSLSQPLYAQQTQFPQSSFPLPQRNSLIMQRVYEYLYGGTNKYPYYERQEYSTNKCGMHTVNNLLGWPVFCFDNVNDRERVTCEPGQINLFYLSDPIMQNLKKRGFGEASAEPFFFLNQGGVDFSLDFIMQVLQYYSFDTPSSTLLRNGQIQKPADFNYPRFNAFTLGYVVLANGLHGRHYFAIIPRDDKGVNQFQAIDSLLDPGVSEILQLDELVRVLIEDQNWGAKQFFRIDYPTLQDNSLDQIKYKELKNTLGNIRTTSYFSRLSENIDTKLSTEHDYVTKSTSLIQLASRKNFKLSETDKQIYAGLQARFLSASSSTGGGGASSSSSSSSSSSTSASAGGGGGGGGGGDGLTSFARVGTAPKQKKVLVLCQRKETDPGSSIEQLSQLQPSYIGVLRVNDIVQSQSDLRGAKIEYLSNFPISDYEFLFGDNETTRDFVRKFGHSFSAIIFYTCPIMFMLDNEETIKNYARLLLPEGYVMFKGGNSLSNVTSSIELYAKKFFTQYFTVKYVMNVDTGMNEVEVDSENVPKYYPINTFI